MMRATIRSDRAFDLPAIGGWRYRYVGKGLWLCKGPLTYGWERLDKIVGWQLARRGWC